MSVIKDDLGIKGIFKLLIIMFMWLNGNRGWSRKIKEFKKILLFIDMDIGGI